MAILQKPGPLTLTEWKEIKRHTEIGYRIAQATPELAMVADSILSHHERWDGQGYPRGIKEAEIPLLCRILSITDAFDAMTNDRVYRRAIPREAAIQELKVNAGGQFDPHITDIFIQTLSVESEGA
ncbi:Cyclic di-GMP phosphodiesterase [bioreactor metagenome]|uniref:Cyclic di-GMP phosphodiesterase n=1 Tax=bioreactor metagenome TaxID=1076179 RepID=A0A645DRP5_9ZZZZ